MGLFAVVAGVQILDSHAQTRLLADPQNSSEQRVRRGPPGAQGQAAGLSPAGAVACGAAQLCCKPSIQESGKRAICSLLEGLRAARHSMRGATVKVKLKPSGGATRKEPQAPRAFRRSTAVEQSPSPGSRAWRTAERRSRPLLPAWQQQTCTRTLATCSWLALSSSSACLMRQGACVA